MGFTLCATRGTMIHLLQHDIECERAYKVNEARRPNIVDTSRTETSTSSSTRPAPMTRGRTNIIIRSSAIAAKTSYWHDLASAQAAWNA